MPDPYATLGLTPTASDQQLRTAYRTLVKRHHPDHNGGSPESAKRFEEIQAAYAEILLARNSSGDIDARLAAIEAELKRQRPPARPVPAAQPAAATRPATRAATPEELGQYTTEDSFSAILDDAGAAVARHVSRWLRGEQ
jgi:hypothetical protein